MSDSSFDASRRTFLQSTAAMTAAAAAMAATEITPVAAQPAIEEEFRFAPNYDEAKVPDFELPDPLMSADGGPVETAAEWPQRRTEIRAMVERLMYGYIPETMQGRIFHAETLESSDDALGDMARRRQIRLFLTERRARPYVDLLIYLPKQRPVATFLGLSFEGNASTTDDPAVLVPEWEAWQGKDARGQRGSQKNRWCFEPIIAAKMGSITAHYYDIAPDFDEPDRARRRAEWYGDPTTVESIPDDGAGAVAEWAWGLSRILDYLETEPEIDADRIIVHGHSRLGKTSLWAGATDERFAGVIVNNSGAGGAAMSKRAFGETVWRLNTSFPHWFCRNFRQFNNNESALPFDQHEVISLCAPRPVLVASAEKDEWADPRGEFLSMVFAEPVYMLLGGAGLAVPISHFENDGMPSLPPFEEPINCGDLTYYIRHGVHDVTPYDWEQWIRFARRVVEEK